jgi:hypothetical protein
MFAGKDRSWGGKKGGKFDDLGLNWNHDDF